jgi:protein-tyrosine phosphatase
MAQRKPFPTFWWYRDGSVAGMARPGFNHFDWQHLSLPEAALLSWIGKLDSPRATLSDLSDHIDWYLSSVGIFEDAPAKERERQLRPLLDAETLLDRISALNEKTEALTDFGWDGDTLRLDFNDELKRREIASLRECGIEILVSLVESPPDDVVVDSALEVHHLPIGDLTPPSREQVRIFASLLERAETERCGLVAHCLAGIGRTSTILMAGHLMRGHGLRDVRREVEERNPRYGFAGRQWEFLQALSREVMQ